MVKKPATVAFVVSMVMAVLNGLLFIAFLYLALFEARHCGGVDYGVCTPNWINRSPVPLIISVIFGVAAALLFGPMTREQLQ